MHPPGPPEIDERFDTLDETVWTAAYLPAWSSLAAAAAVYRIGDDGLQLRIDPQQQLWCADRHETPMRVSAVQSGNWSGPVGTTRGQQPFRAGLSVREQQQTQWGFTPLHGWIEVTCRARIGPGSMFSAWLVGLEDEPTRCGEICLVEVFGDRIDGDTVEYGCGVHAFRDPALTEEFSAARVELDVRRWHRYGIDWRPDGIDFVLDGAVLKRIDQAPDYPMQLILGVFDFPAEQEAVAPAELVVGAVVGRRRAVPRQNGEAGAG